MPLLIDGHNLIGSGVLPDIRLDQEDDEARLVARLRVWKSRYRGKMTVVFDHGITSGRSRELSGGGVETIFARNPQDADALIRRRLRRKQRGLVLVSNDDALRQEAARSGVTVWQAGEFIQRMAPPTPPAVVDPGTQDDLALSANEVDEWMALFDAAPRRTAGSRQEESNGTSGEHGRSRIRRDKRRGTTRNDRARR